MQLTKEITREIIEAIESSDMRTQIHIDKDTISIVPEGQELDPRQAPKKIHIGILTHKGHDFLIYFGG